MIKRAADGSPWYQNSWPWFIVGLLGISVLGSLGTVYIAFVYGDVEVDRSSPVRPTAQGVETRDGG